MKVRKYTTEDAMRWDSFVMDGSANGTFLQTRRFLSYHPAERFVDASYMIYDDKDKLVAVCPACEIIDDGLKVFYSHKGSTYGGLVFADKKYYAEGIIEAIGSLEEQLKIDGYQRVILKPTASIFAKKESALLEYVLYYMNYKSEDELNLYVDLDDAPEEMISLVSRGRRPHIHACEKAGVSVRKLESSEEIQVFHNILSENLEKYKVKPVHTVDELILLQKILKDEIEFFGSFLNGEMIAGTMVFIFAQVGVAHTQYLCAKQSFDDLSPMSFIYYSMMLEYKKRGYHKLNWGISSEHGGKELNFGLTRSKESYGSTYSLVRSFEKKL